MSEVQSRKKTHSQNWANGFLPVHSNMGEYRGFKNILCDQLRPSCVRLGETKGEVTPSPFVAMHARKVSKRRDSRFQFPDSFPPS